MKIPSPSMFVSLTALVVALGGAGIAATGGNFILGQNNNATTRSQLTTPIGSEALRLSNTSAAAGATGLFIVTNTANPPMRVSSEVQVAKLNADMVDGKHAVDLASASSEGWHYIGASGEPPFEWSWGNIGSPFRGAAYRIDQLGNVHLAGRIGGGVISSDNLPPFALSPPYCPANIHEFAVPSNFAFGMVRITPIVSSGTYAGRCALIVVVGNSSWVDLDGISYQTESKDNLVAPPPAVAGVRKR